MYQSEAQMNPILTGPRWEEGARTEVPETKQKPATQGCRNSSWEKAGGEAWDPLALATRPLSLFSWLGWHCRAPSLPSWPGLCRAHSWPWRLRLKLGLTTLKECWKRPGPLHPHPAWVQSCWCDEYSQKRWRGKTNLWLQLFTITCSGRFLTVALVHLLLISLTLKQLKLTNSSHS